MPRRLKGRLEVRRELRLYHHPAPKYTLCRSKSRTLCIRMHQLVLHWVQGRCIALRNVRTLGDFSATVVLRHYCHGRTLPTASGTLQLEKSVISCSTDPQLHRSTAPDFFPTPKPRLLCSLLNPKPSTPPTSIEVLSILSVLHFAQNSWNLTPPSTSILLALLDLACSIELGLREKIRISQLTTY